MDNRRNGIIAELKNNEEEIIAFFKGLDSAQLGMTVYPDKYETERRRGETNVLCRFFRYTSCFSVKQLRHWLQASRTEKRAVA